jgi:transposase-like protein
MSLSDIKLQIQELYGADISESLISKITDDVMDDVKAWQSRPLESVYPIVFFDCSVLKVRQDKRIINKAAYVALGIDSSGQKDILGLWISENEGAKFWLGNLTEMKNRGMRDMLIACTDNLTGMSDAISAVYPKTEYQLCIVHQIRNSLRYVSYKDRKQLVEDLRPIYTALTEDEAHYDFRVSQYVRPLGYEHSYT